MERDAPPRPVEGGRATQACDMCRKKKIKCDQKSPACSPCMKSDTSCIYAPKIKEYRVHSKKATQFKQLEGRLSKMETLLRLPPFVLERMIQEYSGTRGAKPQTRGFLSIGDGEPSSESRQAQNDIYGPGIVPPTPSIVTRVGPGDEMRISASKNDLTLGDAALGMPINTSNNVWKVNAIDEAFAPSLFLQLPPKEKAIIILDFYFVKFNNFYPIFSRPEFMKKMEDMYQREYHGDIGWWACLNVGLALGCRLKSMSSMARWDEEDNASGYMENALAVAPALALQMPSLVNIQALLGIAIFLQGTANPRSYSLLVATAIRLGQNLGLHREDAYAADLTAAEREQRKRVFWLGYMLDRDISMRSGQPPVLHDNDIDVELPGENFGDGVGYMILLHRNSPLNLFRARIQLAVLQGAIYEQLYGAAAGKQPEGMRQAAIEELDYQLEKWKESLSLNFEAKFLTEVVPEKFSILHIVIIYFTYFNCLTLIHRSSFQNVAWKARSLGVVEPFNPYIFSPKKECIETARRAVNLLKLIPQGNYACIWLLLNFSASAVITLLHNIYYNPSLPTSVPDYELVMPLLGLLDGLMSENLHSHPTINGEHQQQSLNKDPNEKGRRTELVRMRNFCFALRDRAKEAIEEAASNGNSVWAGGSIDPVADANNAIRDSDAQWTDLGLNPAASEADAPDASQAHFVRAFMEQFSSTFSSGPDVSAGEAVVAADLDADPQFQTWDAMLEPAGWQISSYPYDVTTQFHTPLDANDENSRAFHPSGSQPSKSHPLAGDSSQHSAASLDFTIPEGTSEEALWNLWCMPGVGSSEGNVNNG